MGFLKNSALAIAGAASGYMLASTSSDRIAAERNRALASGKRIVVLGLGFGGLAVANELCALLPGDDNGEITVIDEDNYLLFTPMLTEAVGGEIDPRHIAVPIQRLGSRVRFLQGAVENIDLGANTVRLKLGSAALAQQVTTIQADYLVIALGSITNFHDVPGAAQNAFTVKHLQDAQAICDHALNCLQRASNLQDSDERRALLTFVVAGGGYTGVETMAALNDLVRDRAATYNVHLENDIRTILVNPTDRLLGETSEQLAEYATTQLRHRSVDVRLNTSVRSCSRGEVELSNGERVRTDTFVWAAGVRPNPVIQSLDCEKGHHGGIKTEANCQIVGRTRAFAIGDCAEIPNPSGKTYAPTAQNATREGALVARNIVRALKHQALQPFVYEPIGQLALVGKHAGVARIWGMNISGLCAWAMWRAVYLAKMPSASQRARVVLDWSMDLLFGRTPVPLGAEPSQQQRNHEGVATAD